MGCGGSKKENDSEIPDTSDKRYQEYLENPDNIKYGQSYNKQQKPDLSKNPNQFVLNSINYYKKQNPSSNSFSDEIFPPNSDSFFGKKKGEYIDKDDKRREENLSLIKNLNINENDIEWKHAKDIWKNSDIFNNEIKPNDIKLGLLPDAYFISCLISLSEFPQLILQLFRTVKLPEDKKPIEIAFKIDGEWKVISLDDKFPVKKGTKEPICSNTNNNCLWGVFLEKAWAKVNGGYVNICNGNPREVFETLTPFSCVPIDISKEDNVTFWRNIRDSDAFDCIMTCNTKSKSSLKEKGLISNHTYCLKEAYEKEFNNEIIKLIKLINPFGKGEWNGDWSDESDKWNDYTRGLFNFNEKLDDGQFYISYEDFLKYFSNVCICVPIRPFKSTSIKVSKENASTINVLKIYMENPGILTVNLGVKDFHFHRKIKDKEKVIYNLILAKVERKYFEYIDSCHNEILSTEIREEGEYILLYHVDYFNPKIEPRKYSINIGSSTKFKLCICEPDSEFNLLKSIIITKVQNLPKYKERFTNPIVMFTGNRFMNTAYAFFYIQNQEKTTAHIKPNLTLNNIISLEGDVPNLKLKKGDIYLLVGIRENIDKDFKTSVKAENFPESLPDEIQPMLNNDILKKYRKEDNYIKDIIYDFEFDQKDGSN